MEHERDEAAEGSATHAAVRNDQAGNLVEREQEDDVAGKGRSKDTVVDGVGGEGEQREDSGNGRENLWARYDMGDEETAEPGAGESAEDTASGAGERVRDPGSLDEQCGHGDPVAGLNAEAAIDFGGRKRGEKQAQGIAESLVARELGKELRKLSQALRDGPVFVVDRAED